MDGDNDTLIALVASLLKKPANQDAILHALICHNGSVEAAADSLNGGPPSSPSTSGNKRKREKCLDGWLKPPPSKISKAVIPPIPSTSTKSTLEYKTTAESSTSAGKMSPVPAATPASSSMISKPSVNLMDVLKRPVSSGKSNKTAPRLPPLMLSNPSMVAEHTPCTLHPSILPPELACSLFYVMCKHSQSWKRNKWWLFDRVVESPHLTSFWARNFSKSETDEEWRRAAQHWYNGRQSEPPLVFPPEMEAACLIVEKVVQKELAKRLRFPLEYAGSSTWQANVAASNRYLGSDESVGFHSDQLTGIGPYATIASLSLGVRRNFTLKEVIPNEQKATRSARTLNVPLSHNSLIIMHASCQERFKHSVPPQSTIDLFHPPYPPPISLASEINEVDYSKTRINITFRFYRPDFQPSTIPKCHCGIPTILRPDMKNRVDGEGGMTEGRYWWTCYAGAQNDGKGCNFWQVMDFDNEGRGPAVKDRGKDVITDTAEGHLTVKDTK